MTSGGVAILGASGFLGKEISSYFLEKTDNVFLLSKNGGKTQKCNIDAIDLLDPPPLEAWITHNDIRTVVYLSSVVPKTFAESTWDLFQKNLSMHRAILNIWSKEKFHLIYASGCSVYGRMSPLPWNEQGIAMPENYYTASKYVGEILLSMESLNDLPLTILRINAPYGANNRNKTVVNIFLERALENHDLQLQGTGQREQDFIYVKDVARAFWLAHRTRKTGIFNIASGNTTTMKDLASMIIGLTGSQSRVIYSGTPDPQEGNKVAIDVIKARKELGFLPKYSMKDGLLDCIGEYQKLRMMNP